jgi:succinyl-diaminopimelate desuccinylase
MGPFNGITETETIAEIETLLASLIGINTVNPPGNEAALAGFIKDCLGREGEGSFFLMDHGKGRASMVFDIPGHNPARTIGFAGHLDTVPAGEGADWLSDPFTAERRGGFVYGRGAADMKGGLAAMLLLARFYLRTVPPVNLRFIFTADEETSGMGAAVLGDAGWFRDLSFLVVCEPTDGYPVICEKGLLWYDFTVQGKASHAAMPEQGINALETGYEYLAVVKEQIAALPVERSSAVKLLGGNTCSITLGSAGIKINVIPDRSAFSVDVRLVPGTGVEQVEAVFDQTARKFERRYPGLVIYRHCRENRAALETDMRHPATAFFADLCGREAGKQPRGVYYFTDASIIIPACPNLPFIILGPGLPSDCHSPNEKVAPESVAEAVSRYYQFVEAIQDKWFR